MATVDITDNSAEVRAALEQAKARALEIIGGNRMTEYTTEELMAEIASRDGVQYMKARKGQPLELNAPEDEWLLVVPLDAMPHKETAKEKEQAIRLRFIEKLMEGFENGKSEYAPVLMQMLNGR